MIENLIPTTIIDKICKKDNVPMVELPSTISKLVYSKILKLFEQKIITIIF
jgi:hypothetical protein